MSRLFNYPREHERDTAPRCRPCGGTGMIERRATPEEVDAGCELGIAYDHCIACQATGYAGGREP